MTVSLKINPKDKKEKGVKGRRESWTVDSLLLLSKEGSVHLRVNTIQGLGTYIGTILKNLYVVSRCLVSLRVG